MNSEQFVDLMRSASFSEEDIAALEKLVAEYPWFALPRFLKLKAAAQLGMETSAGETGNAVVFSSDRRHLYRWINGEAGSMIETSHLLHSELEFLDENGTLNAPADEDAFTLIEENVEDHGEDADVQAIPEKEETEMEEPETEEPALPVIDPLDDDEEDEPADLSPEVEQEEFPEREMKSIQSEPQQENSQGRKEGEVNHPETQSEVSIDQDEDVDDNLIERFLKNEPGVIKADKTTNLEGDISEHSVQEDDSFITDTLAKIYVKQGLHAKAIYAYERLSLKYPEKSAYFAAQIEKIKNITNV